MPWTAATFAKHNKKLHGVPLEKAAAQATAVLKAGVPEGEAIAIANKQAKKSRRERLYAKPKSA